MSSIYINEPPTFGKVVLHTTVGEIEIELWSKECPKTCRNFVQLGMEGFYDETIFHRLVKGFIVQGGDPTGTGMGGESIYDGPFKDELHQRLRFVRRGLLAMANSGAHDNLSQFFFTFDKAPDLERKHTIFGKVVGNTLFNMLKLEESEVDNNEKPLNPHKIRSFEVILNPFDDIKPREKMKKDKSKAKNKSKSSAVKNFNLLSFGDEAEDDEEEMHSVNQEFCKPKSAHDLLSDEKLSKELAVEKGEIGQDNQSASSSEDEEAKSAQRERIKAKLNVVTGKTAKRKAAIFGKEENEDVDLHEMVQNHKDEQKQNKILEMRNEIKRLKREMRKEDEKEEEIEDEDLPEVIVKYRAEKQKYKEMTKAQPKRHDSQRETQTLELLEKFKEKLQAAKSNPVVTENVEEIAKNVKIDSRLDYFSEGEGEKDEEGFDWSAYQLKTSKEIQEKIVKRPMDANWKTEDDFDISDPRHPLNKKRREGGQKKSHKTHKEKGEKKEGRNKRK